MQRNKLEAPSDSSAATQMIYTCQLRGEIRGQTVFFHVRLVVILYFATSFYISIHVLVQEEE